MTEEEKEEEEEEGLTCFSRQWGFCFPLSSPSRDAARSTILRSFPRSEGFMRGFSQYKESLWTFRDNLST